MNPLERRKRGPIEVVIGMGNITQEDFANYRLGENDAIYLDMRFKPDRTPAEQFRDRARDLDYDFTPLTEEELDRLPSLARKFLALFSEMPESRNAYRIAMDSLEREKRFSFMKNGTPFEVVFGVSSRHLPYLSVTDLLCDPGSGDILTINDSDGMESDGKNFINCEGNFNDQEALLSAEGLLLEQFGGPIGDTK